MAPPLPNENAPLLAHPYVPPSATVPHPSYTVSIPPYPPSTHDITSSSHTRPTRPKPSFSLSSLVYSTLRWLFYLTFLSTFILSLYLSLTYLHTPCEHPLPYLLAIIGLTGCVWLLVIPYQVQLEERASPTWEVCCIRTTWTLRLLCFLTLLAANSLATDWLWGMGGEGMQCPRVVYSFTLYLVIGWWVLVGLGLIVLIGLITVMCCAFVR